MGRDERESQESPKPRFSATNGEIVTLGKWDTQVEMFETDASGTGRDGQDQIQMFCKKTVRLTDWDSTGTQVGRRSGNVQTSKPMGHGEDGRGSRESLKHRNRPAKLRLIGRFGGLNWVQLLNLIYPLFNISKVFFSHSLSTIRNFYRSVSTRGLKKKTSGVEGQARDITW